MEFSHKKNKKKACVSKRKPGFFYSTNFIKFNNKNARNGIFIKKKETFLQSLFIATNGIEPLTSRI